MAVKTEYEELLKIGYHYDIRLKDSTEFHDCYLTVKDLESRMLKIRTYTEIGGEYKLYSETLLNMNDIRVVTTPKKKRFFWLSQLIFTTNYGYLMQTELSDGDIELNKDFVFYDSEEDAIIGFVKDNMATSANPRNWELKHYFSGNVIAKHTGDNLANGGWVGSNAKLVDQILDDCNKNK